jgi:hypothetical protein
VSNEKKKKRVAYNMGSKVSSIWFAFSDMLGHMLLAMRRAATVLISFVNNE